MTNIIQTSTSQTAYRTGCSNPARNGKAQQSTGQPASFFDLAAKAGQASLTNAPAASGNAAESLPGYSTFLSVSTWTAAQLRANGVIETEATSLESMLKAKYPNLVYHVGDISSSSGCWNRNDYPHYLLYQPGDDAVKQLENWKPIGPDPSYGTSAASRRLGTVTPGSKAVVIHPAVQERVEQDPEYANQIMAKIDAWFAFDVARNEAIIPGITVGMNQAVVIGEDGSIANVVSSSQPHLTCSDDGDDISFLEKWWILRMAKHDDYLLLLKQAQLRFYAHQLDQKTVGASLAAARSALADLLNNGNLQAIFGDTIAGIPTETILACARNELAGNISPGI